MSDDNENAHILSCSGESMNFSDIAFDTEHVRNLNNKSLESYIHDVESDVLISVESHSELSNSKGCGSLTDCELNSEIWNKFNELALMLKETQNNLKEMDCLVMKHLKLKKCDNSKDEDHISLDHEKVNEILKLLKFLIAKLYSLEHSVNASPETCQELIARLTCSQSLYDVTSSGQEHQKHSCNISQEKRLNENLSNTSCRNSADCLDTGNKYQHNNVREESCQTDIPLFSCFSGHKANTVDNLTESHLQGNEKEPASFPLYKETLSIRRDLDDIISRKCALDVQLQQLLEQKKLANMHTVVIAENSSKEIDQFESVNLICNTKDNDVKCSSYFSDQASSQLSLPHAVAIEELKNDEVDIPGLENGGLSNEINSLNLGIQKLIWENQSLHSALQDMTVGLVAKNNEESHALRVKISNLCSSEDGRVKISSLCRPEDDININGSVLEKIDNHCLADNHVSESSVFIEKDVDEEIFDRNNIKSNSVFLNDCDIHAVVWEAASLFDARYNELQERLLEISCDNKEMLRCLNNNYFKNNFNSANMYSQEVEVQTENTFPSCLTTQACSEDIKNNIYCFELHSLQNNFFNEKSNASLARSCSYCSCNGTLCECSCNNLCSNSNKVQLYFGSEDQICSSKETQTVMFEKKSLESCCLLDKYTQIEVYNGNSVDIALQTDSLNYGKQMFQKSIQVGLQDLKGLNKFSRGIQTEMIQFSKEVQTDFLKLFSQKRLDLSKEMDLFSTVITVNKLINNSNYHEVKKDFDEEEIIADCEQFSSNYLFSVSCNTQTDCVSLVTVGSQTTFLPNCCLSSDLKYVSVETQCNFDDNANFPNNLCHDLCSSINTEVNGKYQTSEKVSNSTKPISALCISEKFVQTDCCLCSNCIDVNGIVTESKDKKQELHTMNSNAESFLKLHNGSLESLSTSFDKESFDSESSKIVHNSLSACINAATNGCGIDPVIVENSQLIIQMEEMTIITEDMRSQIYDLRRALKCRDEEKLELVEKLRYFEDGKSNSDVSSPTLTSFSASCYSSLEMKNMKAQIAKLELELEQKLKDGLALQENLKKEKENSKKFIWKMESFESELSECRDQLQERDEECKALKCQLKEALMSSSLPPSECCSDIKNNAIKDKNKRKYMELLMRIEVEALRIRLLEASEQEKNIRISGLQHSFNECKLSYNLLQEKYKKLKQSYLSKQISHKKTIMQMRNFIENFLMAVTNVDNCYQSMMSSLGENIDIAVEIFNSHMLLDHCYIHSTSSSMSDCANWFLIHCARIKYLQKEIRKMCLHNWKTLWGTGCTTVSNSSAAVRNLLLTPDAGHQSLPCSFLGFQTKKADKFVKSHSLDSDCQIVFDDAHNLKEVASFSHILSNVEKGLGGKLKLALEKRELVFAIFNKFFESLKIPFSSSLSVCSARCITSSDFQSFELPLSKHFLTDSKHLHKHPSDSSCIKDWSKNEGCGHSKRDTCEKCKSKSSTLKGKVNGENNEEGGLVNIKKSIDLSEKYSAEDEDDDTANIDVSFQDMNSNSNLL